MFTKLSPSSNHLVTRLIGLPKTFALATLLGGSLTTAGWAQAVNTITLKYEGGEDITGEFIEEVDGLIKIKASIGMIAIPIEGLSCVGAACPEGTHIALSEDTITLKTKDGKVSLTGHLIAIENDQYVIATNIGEITVDISTVDCEGYACLSSDDVAKAEFAFGGNVVLVSDAGQLAGVLTDIVDDAYVINTSNLGLLRVSTTTYTCEGDGCP